MALLEAALDLLLAVLGLDMGAIWLAPHRVSRGLPKGAIRIGEAVRAAGLTIPSIQAVPDWEAVGETHPELAPIRETMRRLGIRASIAVSLEHKGRGGGFALAAPRPRAWTVIPRGRRVRPSGGFSEGLEDRQAGAPSGCPVQGRPPGRLAGKLRLQAPFRRDRGRL